MSPTPDADLVPQPPGRLGETIAAEKLLAYLAGMTRWLDVTTHQLGQVDRAALETEQADVYTPDIVLAQSLRQSVSVRLGQLEELWDSGRADTETRERMSTLIWGRLHPSAAATSGTAISFVEAVRLCSSLLSHLNNRLSLDPAQAGVADRISGLRAELERCRDLAPRHTQESAAVDRLRARLEVIAERHARGADVEGPLQQLERETAITERDLIIAASQTQTVERDRDRARELYAAGMTRGARLTRLADRCRREIVNAPHFAVPDVSRLGEPPSDPEALELYLEKLTTVGLAFAQAESAYAAPLRRRASLNFRVRQLLTRAEANGRIQSATATAAIAEAREALESVPCSIPLAEHFLRQLEVVTLDVPEEPERS